MPDVTVEKGITLDLVPTKKPATSATSDAPVVETRPDSKPAAAEAKQPEPTDTQEHPEEPSADDKPKAKGVQKRLDELTRNWREEQRARERTQAQLDRALSLLEQKVTGKAETTDDAEPQEPDPSKYTDQAAFNADYKKYWLNLVEWKADQKLKTWQQKEREAREREESEKQTRTVQERYLQNVEKAREKYADYDSVTRNPSLPITQPMAQAIMLHENGTDIAYHLGTNPQEAVRIASLPRESQLLELGVIAATLKQTPVAKPPVSIAPKPIKPLGGGTASAVMSPEEESMEAYAARRKKELGKR